MDGVIYANDYYGSLARLLTEWNRRLVERFGSDTCGIQGNNLNAIGLQLIAQCTRRSLDRVLRRCVGQKSIAAAARSQEDQPTSAIAHMPRAREKKQKQKKKVR